ncbi:serine/threonine kinase [Tribonema minus]|uniref:Cyclin-dependent kinase 2 homolog n=1 Tax=Tribonema minus TaxID=303371 RepID=A0A836CI29_9STRA|nr:serine/threonine kinase [Tribonema minus]
MEGAKGREGNEAADGQSFSASTAALFHGAKGVFGNCRPVSTYEKLGRIGQGAYGTVYEAIDKETKRPVALKRVILHNEKQDGFPLTSLREVALLKRIAHSNCVALLDVAVGRNRDGVFLVFEYCEHDLAHLLETVRRPFSVSEVKTVMQQLLRAVAYLHDNWIIHRDLKMSNLLYTNRGQLKLADFGLARTYGYPPRPMTPTVVTLWYRAPELLLGCESYTTAIDTWAAGCVLGELVRGEPLLPGKTPVDQLSLTCALLGTPTERIWPGMEALPALRGGTMTVPQGHQYNTLASRLPELSRAGAALLDALLTYDPAKRHTAREALAHAFFAEHPLPKEEVLMPTFPAVHAQPSAARGSGGGGGAGRRGGGWADLDRDAVSAAKKPRR